jgi:hypothetical protein
MFSVVYFLRAVLLATDAKIPVSWAPTSAPSSAPSANQAQLLFSSFPKYGPNSILNKITPVLVHMAIFKGGHSLILSYSGNR